MFKFLFLSGFVKFKQLINNYFNIIYFRVNFILDSFIYYIELKLYKLVKLAYLISKLVLLNRNYIYYAYLECYIKGFN